MNNSRWGSLFGMVATLTIVGSAAAFWILHLGKPTKAEAPKSAAPATQTASVKEGELNVLTLTPEAETRLAIKVENLARRKVARLRTLGGEIVLPPGQAVTVSAPFPGTIKPAAGGGAILPGLPLKKGQVVFTLLPLLTNEARTTLATSLVDADGQVKNAEVQLSAADVALKRATQLVAEQAGSKRAVDEAQAAHDLAQKTLEAARARHDVIAKTLEGSGAGSGTALNVESPADGIARNVFVAPGQVVSSAAPLFEVANQDKLWIRVPVYVGEINDLATDRPASVARLGKTAADPGVTAKLIAAPPTATAATASRDLYYQADEPAKDWVPGQRVSVAIPAKSEEESLVIPWSAVVHDVNGGAWVYEVVGPHKYARQRVAVHGVVDGAAVLSAGPKVGTPVVTRGVAELFGREMGFAK